MVKILLFVVVDRRDRRSNICISRLYLDVTVCLRLNMCRLLTYLGSEKNDNEAI